MDVLSEVLKVIELKGALYYNGEFSAPWSIRSAPAQLAQHLAPGANHVIIYHLLLSGRALVELESGERVQWNAGEIVMVPHGDTHVMSNGAASMTYDDAENLGAILEQGLKLWRLGGSGELSRFVCGYMSCDPELSTVVLSGLPRVFKVGIRDDASGKWIEDSIRYTVEKSDHACAGDEAVVAKLSETLFVETLRRYIASLPDGHTGWLAGARDPEVGKTLAIMHRDPAHPWTLADLAKAVGSSRSVLAERFRQYLNEPPMSYLTRWRMQLGAQRLLRTSHSIAQIAQEVGYESEAAFNRAFKRQFAAPPAQFRREQRRPAALRAAAAT